MIDFKGKKCSNKISGKTYSGYETNFAIAKTLSLSLLNNNRSYNELLICLSNCTDYQWFLILSEM